LNHGRYTEAGQRDPQRPHPLGAGLHRRIHLVSRLMRMRPEEMRDLRPHPRRPSVLITVAVVMTVPMAVAVASALITHTGQDARQSPLQHLDNSAGHAVARRSR